MTSVWLLRSRASVRMSSPEPSGIIKSVRTMPYGVGALRMASRPALNPGAAVTS